MFRQSSLELNKAKDIWGKGITLIKTLKPRYKRGQIFLSYFIPVSFLPCISDNDHMKQTYTPSKESILVHHIYNNHGATSIPRTL